MESSARQPERDLLSRLPEEVVDIIANHSYEGVIQLRATCRTLQHKTWRSFSQRFFAERYTRIDRASLDRLRDISTDECLSKCVMRLIVRLDFWDQDAIHEGGNVDDHFAHEQLNDQWFLLQSGEATLYFCELLTNLSHLESVDITYGTRDDDCWPNTHYKTPTSYEDIGLQVGSYEQHSASSIWLAVISAISRTDTRLKHLRSSSNLPYDTIGSIPPVIARSLSKSFACLQTLELGIIIPHTQPYYDVWHKSFTAFLRTCPNIISLDIIFDKEGEDDQDHDTTEPSLNSFAQWPTFQKLRKLYLSDIEVAPQELVDYLQRHQSSLEDLDIDSRWFGFKEGRWRIVLKSLSSFTDLASLHFPIYGGPRDIDAREYIANQIGVVLDQGPVQPQQGVPDDVLDDGNDGNP